MVRLAGELDIATVPALADYLSEQTAANPVHLALDLAAVTLLAADGVALIVRAHRNEHGIHGRLHLLGVTGNRPVERVLDLTGMLAVLTVHDSLDDLWEHLDRS
jgi:anti-sigma B factor antagonist